MELTLKSTANYICMIEKFFMISEGVQTCRQSPEKLFPSEYLNLPLRTTQVEHSSANYTIIIIIIKNNLEKIKYFMESDWRGFLV